MSTKNKSRKRISVYVEEGSDAYYALELIGRMGKVRRGIAIQLCLGELPGVIIKKGLGREMFDKESYELLSKGKSVKQVYEAVTRKQEKSQGEEG